MYFIICSSSKRVLPAYTVRKKGGKPRDSIKTKYVSDHPGLTENKLVDPLFLFCRYLQYTVGRNEKKTIARYCPFKEPMSTVYLSASNLWFRWVFHVNGNPDGRTGEGRGGS
jgi:hypothetical protein